MQPVVVEATFALKAPPEQVWPFIADTDRMNRRLGLSGVKYTPLDDPSRTGARIVGETRLGGFATRYEEQPWEWTWTRGLSVHRDFQGSPIAWLNVSWRMEPAEGGSKLVVKLEAMPRLLVMRPVVWINLKQSAAGFGSLALEIEQHLASGAPTPFLGPRTKASALAKRAPSMWSLRPWRRAEVAIAAISSGP